jgi:glycosyltransferase involved in cell wall biosynthesis
VNATPVPLVIADGDIATTRLLARELGVVYPRVEIKVPETLFGTLLPGRPIVISRLCHPSLSWFPGYLAQHGWRYAYFLDDNFWELTDDVDPHLAPFYTNPAVVATLAAFVRGAAVVIVWSPLLRDYIAAKFPGAMVECTLTGVDFARLPSARPTFGRHDADVIRVGYPTSRRPAVAALLADVVGAIGRRYAGRVQFEFMGWMPEALEGQPHVTLTPHMADYDRYLEYVQSREWDVGLAPLAGTHFESFKTDVKYREYASLRVPAVYSRVSPYTESVTDGRTGLLAGNTVDAWISALTRLIESRELRLELADAAVADVRQHRDLRVTGRRFAALLPPPELGAAAT